jgi:hypothetical protein
MRTSSMQPSTIRIPAPAAGDSSDVTEALELARTYWEGGHHGEAIRWVRRAVEAADEGGDTARVVVLARAVADLGTASAPPPARSTRPAGEHRRRVFVKTSARDPNLLVVRPLAEGQHAPLGTREAFLVMAAPEDAETADSIRSKAR